MASDNNNRRYSSTTLPPSIDDSSPQQQNEGNSSESSTVLSLRPLHVVFIHLDWGIGGAEQLMLQLVQASVRAQHRVTLVTTRCDPNHCFEALKPDSDSNLRQHLRVWGQWIPTSIFRKAHAACSTIRLLYLAYRVVRRYSLGHGHRRPSPPDLIVLDVLPTPLPFLQSFTESALLFYCHFPDQLLLQQQQKSKKSSSLFVQRLYRSCLDRLEGICMGFADSLAVNSKFTQSVVQATFPQLTEKNDNSDATTDNHRLPVLYPALDTASLDQAISMATSTTTTESDESTRTSRPLIVSLNRYERKKNLGLVIQAAAWFKKKLQQQQQQTSDKSQLVVFPKFIIAGGYDVKNVENVEHYSELQTMAQEYGLEVPTELEFQRSISDAARQELLQTATAVLYTPDAEHFGIVPLEAMYCQTPVIACNSGGPTETVVHGVTGYLCSANDNDEHSLAASFGQALWELLDNSSNNNKAETMGRAARQHVLDHFSEDRLGREWNILVQAAVGKGRARVAARPWYYPGRRLLQTSLHGGQAVVTLVVCWVVSAVLRHVMDVLGLQHVTDASWDFWTRWIVRLRNTTTSGTGDGVGSEL